MTNDEAQGGKAASQPAKIAISGASGLVGSALRKRFEGKGSEVLPIRRVARQGAVDDGVAWHQDSGWIDREKLEGLDVVIHLAGEPIMGRWTRAKKEKILESRKQGTAAVAEALRQVSRPPKVFLCASGIHYYGDRNGEVLREGSSPGSGFLAEVCRHWEEASLPAKEAGIRLVNLRFAPVLSADGGMLAKMVPIFQSGLGGRAGSGGQYVSWIAEPDVVAAVDFIVNTEEIGGPINVASPGAVTNVEFARALGKVLGRPSKVPTPAVALRLAMGEMAEEMVLSSIRAYPEKLLSHGFVFEHSELEPALRAVLSPQQVAT